MTADLSYFSPHRVDSPARGGCSTCSHFPGRFYCEHVLCERDGARYVVGLPRDGCARWERQPGRDDERPRRNSYAECPTAISSTSS